MGCDLETSLKSAASIPWQAVLRSNSTVAPSSIYQYAWKGSYFVTHGQQACRQGRTHAGIGLHIPDTRQGFHVLVAMPEHLDDLLR